MSTHDLHLPRTRRVRERAVSAARGATLRPELLALLVLAAVLNLWALSTNGDANEYYSAAVRSMTGSWSAFLFGSFDPTGVMTVDKPPAAFWVQALSARVFGFTSWSILVPQALMGVATVGLTYDLVRRVFGRVAGGAAGLALALTPIAVAISRHNNPDALLILCSVGALWALVRGLEDGRTRWLVLSGVLVGLGFEAKMAAALTIVPGIVLAWMWVAPRGRRAAVRGIAAFSGSAAVVGLAWPVLVWLTPARDRPWVSGTDDNSVWSLIFGYNGLGRLFGQQGGPGGGGMPGGGPGGAANAAGGAPGGMTGAVPGGGAPGGAGFPPGTTGGGLSGTIPGGGTGGGGGLPGGIPGGLPGGAGGRGGGPGGGVFGGDVGPFRLLNEALGGQAGWLLGGALVAGLGILLLSRLRRSDPRTGWLIAVGGAFLATAVAFSKAEGIFHPYYVSLLAPFVAALVGGGIGVAFHALRGRSAGGVEDVASRSAIVGAAAADAPAASVADGGGAFGVGAGGSPAPDGPRATLVTTWTLRLLGPALLLGALATELKVIGTSAGDLSWLRWILVAGTVAAAVVLVLRLSPRVRTVALAAAGALLLVAPGAWAVETLGHPTSGTFPAGGPESAGGGFGGPGGGGARRFRGGADGTAGATRGGIPGAPGGTASGGTVRGSTVPGGAAPGGAGSQGGAGVPPGTTGSGSTTGTPTRGGLGGFGGGGLGGNTETLKQALEYAAKHGGGVVAVSSQNGAASQLITEDGDAQVAAIGGFSGRESQVTVDWLADAVEDGRIRFVLSDGSGGGMRDGRVGASDVLALSAKVGKAVPGVDGLYDLRGLAGALRAAG